MRNCFRILGVIICFFSVNHFFISSREIRHTRGHGSLLKLDTKADQGRNSNFKYFHSIHNAPRRTEEAKPDISQPVFKKRRHRLKQNTWYLGKHSHHFRSKRKAKTPLKIHKKHVRDISETIKDRGLEMITSLNNSPTEVFNSIQPRIEKTKEAFDDLQHIRSLSQDINMIVSKLQLGMVNNNFRGKVDTKSNLSKLEPRQSNVFGSLLPNKTVFQPKNNILNGEISSDINNLIDAQDNPNSVTSYQFNQTLFIPTSATINKRQIDPLLNTVLQMDVIDPDIMKSILNISLQAMGKKQTLEFLANVLKNNSNFIESLSKNILNQSTTSETTVVIVANTSNTFSYASILLILIIIVFISGVVAAGLSVNQEKNTTVNARYVLGSSTNKKTGGKNPNRELQVVTTKTDPCVKEPTPSLKRLIRTSVEDEGFPPRKEATQDVFRRAGVDDYVSVEGFKKWNQNWSESQRKIVSQKEPSTKSIHKYTSSDNIQHSNQDSETSDCKTNCGPRLSKQSLELELISGANESSMSGTKNDLPSIVNKNSHKLKDKCFRRGSNK